MAQHAIAFDTFQHAKKLKEAGFTELQVEAQIAIVKEQAAAINELIDDSLATKRDIKDLETKLEAKIEVSKNELKRDIRELELRMTVKLGSLMVGGIGMLVILMKLLKIY